MKLKAVLVLLAFVALLNAHAGLKFVATAGNDANPGTILLPLRTIQFAVNNAVAGDTIIVRQGIYNEKITCSISGTLSQKIRLIAYPGEEVIVDGTSVAGQSLLFLNNCSNIIVDGIAFQNNYGQDAIGIYIKEEGQNILISNCRVRNVGWTNNFNADPYSVNPTGQAHAILINGRTAAGIKNIAVTNTSVFNIVTGNSEAITFAGNVDSFALAFDTVFNTRNIAVVASGHYSWAVNAGVADSLNKSRHGVIGHCVVYNNRRINNIDAPAGIYVDGAENVYVLNNVSYNNGNGISVGCENAGYNAAFITVANNVIYKNDNAGIVFGSNAAVVKNSYVVGNTVFKDGSAAPFNAGITLQNLDTAVVANNIIVPLTDSHYAVSIFGYTAFNTLVDNNLSYRYTGNQLNLYNQSPPQFIPTNPISADPLFTDTANSVYKLMKTSPAVNTGNNQWPVVIDTDAADSFRVVNGRIDIGAYERQDGGCPATVTIDNTMSLRGKFTASQKIIYNYAPQIITSRDLFFYAPLLEMALPVEINKQYRFEVYQQGCNTN